jgi:hypothetical protein
MGIHLSDFLQDNLALMGHPVSFSGSKKILWVHRLPLQPFKLLYQELKARSLVDIVHVNISNDTFFIDYKDCPL